MMSDKKMVSAVVANTARACDYCIRKRASWYCAADDAFLCQACDRSVHSANPLALRHERVSLKSPSFNHSSDKPSCCIPSWHRGLKRKPRTPRHAKHHNKHNDHRRHESNVGVLKNRPPVVPEIGAEDSTSHEEDTEENQLLYCVPIFKPFVAEMCSSSATSNGFATGTANQASEVTREESKSIQSILLTDDVQDIDSNSPCRFQPSEFTVAEFSIDVDNLLGKGFEGESYGIEELGILDFQERDIKIDLESSMSGSGGGDGGSSSFSSRLRMIKAEDVDGSRGEEMEAMATTYHLDTHTDMLQEPFELTFDYDDYPTTISREEEDIKVVTTDPHLVTEDDRTEERSKNENEKMKILLKLDYEAISKAWASQGSPYMNGERPEMNSDDCWLHTMGACGLEANLPYGEIAMVGTGQAPIGGDGGREARVSRYREKRRTRLFSKKIRYEVRKLNAENRPRMKGRFVKRSSFTTIPFATV